MENTGRLDWSLEARQDEIVILVKKIETKSGIKNGTRSM
jgi:hypothetical protein